MTHLTLAYLQDLEGDKPATNNVPKGPTSLQMAMKGKHKAPDTTSSGRRNGNGKKKKKKIKSHKDKEDSGREKKQKPSRRKTQQNRVSTAQQSAKNTSSPADRTRVSSPHYYDASSQYRPQPKQRASAMKMSFTIGEDDNDHDSNDRVPTTIDEVNDDDQNINDSASTSRFTVSSVNQSAPRSLLSNQENATEKNSMDTTNSSNSTANFCSSSNAIFDQETFESFALDPKSPFTTEGMRETLIARDVIEDQQRKRKRRGGEKKERNNRNDDFSSETSFDNNDVESKQDEMKLDVSVPELEEEDTMVAVLTKLVHHEMGSKKKRENEFKYSYDKSDVQRKRESREMNKEKKGGLLQPHQDKSAIVVADNGMSVLELQMSAFESKIIAMMERREQDLKVIEELRMTQVENRTEIRMLQLAREGDRNIIQELQESHGKDHSVICEMRYAMKNSERQQLLFMTSALNSLSRIFKRR